MRLCRFVPFVACFVVAACANGTSTAQPAPGEGGTPSAWIRYEGGESSGPDPGKLLPGVHRVPPEIDDEVARLALAATGTAIDELTPAQREYLSSWQQS